MSVVVMFWIAWFSGEFLSNVKKTRPKVLTKTSNGRGGWCIGILALVIRGLKAQEQTQNCLLWEVKIQSL